MTGAAAPTVQADASLVPGASAPRLAVIDIGSNSVRLVIFEGARRVPTVVFNEKVLCGLGRGGGANGALNADGVTLALNSLSRFAALIAAMKIEAVDAVATAAIRDAADGDTFVARVRRECGLNIRVLSGAEEAEYAALGVLAADADANGIVGDLGGGSLELVRVEAGELRERATVPLGPFRLMETARNKSRDIRELIDRTLENVSWLDGRETPAVYAVGGAWRTLARMHMSRVEYPLRVIHHYQIRHAEALELTGLVAKQSRRSLARTSGISNRRIDVLPISAQVLNRLLARVAPDKLVFSAYGLREGVNFAHLSAEARTADPLLSTVRAVAARAGRFPEHGDEVAAWSAPLFAEADMSPRLRLAGCLLSDTGWRHHPDYRAEQSFLDVLRHPTLSVDHTERVFLALASYARYTGSEPVGLIADAVGLLAPEMAHRARALGMACRLAHTLTGGARGLLSRFPIEIAGDEIVLRRAEADTALIGEVVAKRFEALARHLKLTARVAALS